MKKIFTSLFLLITLSGYAQKDSLTLVNAPWKVKQLNNDIIWKSIQFSNNELFDSNQNINVVELNSANASAMLGIAYSDSLQLTSQLANKYNAIVAINGSFFKMPGTDPDEEGKLKEKTNEQAHIPNNIDRNRSEVYLRVNKKKLANNNYADRKDKFDYSAGALAFSKDRVNIYRTSYAKQWEDTIQASNVITSGPLLLLDTKLEAYPNDPFCNNRHPRTAIGKKKNGTIVLVTVDGRASQSKGMNIGELQKLMQWLGCVDALNLDGGGSTTMIIKNENNHGVVNYPTDNKKYDHAGERLVANAIIISNTQLPTNKPQEKKVLLPNGWTLTPTGRTLQLGDLPLNIQISPNKKLMAVTNNGQGKQYIQLIDPNSEQILYTQAIERAWYGLQFSTDSKTLYVAGGNDNIILAYPIEGTKLGEADTISLGKKWPTKISPSGIAIDNKKELLYVVTKENNSLYTIDLKTKAILSQLDLKDEAFSCILSPNRDELYISLWGGNSILIYNTKNKKTTAKIATESHPNEIITTKDGRHLLVANANSSSVSVINLKKRKVIETISTTLYPTKLTGSTTNGLAFSEDEKTLYVSNADNNCLAVFDVSKLGYSKSKGFIPTGWYPTSIKTLGNKVFVANGKGYSSLANPRGPQPIKPDDSGYQTGSTEKKEVQYIGSLFKGTLSIFEEPNENELKALSKQVYSNTPYSKAKETEANGLANNPIPRNASQTSPIKYVFYIIKENRTYDQVFGDMPEGNGDPSLCIFPEFVTPNQHALAREFVLLDNFYVDAEVSADGHNWSTAAYANDYVEKTWPISYGGRGGTYDYEGSREIAYPKDGFIWDYCKRAGISFRSYAEFATHGKATLKTLEGHIAPNYLDGLEIMDIEREKIWEADFDSLLLTDQVPRFSTLRFPNDHTVGQRLGKPTPQAMVADNDLAVGRFIEHLSNSKIWKESAVFILEDDAQNGPDHVDAHRSIAFVISPYTKRNSVNSNMYSTSSMLRTMELILGLPPMSQYDAAALPMFDCFTNEPDFRPYKAITNKVNLEDKNEKKTPSAQLSAKWNFKKVDAAPDLDLNIVVWKSVKGEDSEMPMPRRSAFVILEEKPEEDD